jgi:hypothetical protein
MQMISKHLFMIFKPMQAIQTPSLMWTPLAHVIVSIKVWFLSLNPHKLDTLMFVLVFLVMILLEMRI